MLPMKRSESAVQDKHPELHGGYATLLKKKIAHPLRTLITCPQSKTIYIRVRQLLKPPTNYPVNTADN